VKILQKKAAVGLLPVRFQLIEGGSLLPSEFASKVPGQAAIHWLCLQDLRKTNHRQNLDVDLSSTVSARAPPGSWSAVNTPPTGRVV